MALREGLKNAPFMEYPSATGKYILFCDTSKASTGYILNQQSKDRGEHIIACGGGDFYMLKNETNCI